MCCLTCAYFQAVEPPEHKAAREAGKCEGACGDKWDWHTVFRYVQNHKEPLKGFCLLNPVPTPTTPRNACGQHKPVLGSNNGWGVRAYDERDRGLVEWATQQYRNVVLKEYVTWEQERINHLQTMNTRLRQQLATARKRSESRLARLQKQKRKPDRKSVV